MKKKDKIIYLYTIKVSIGKKSNITAKEDKLKCWKAVKKLYWVEDNDEYNKTYLFSTTDVGQMETYVDEDIKEFEFITHYFDNPKLHQENLKKEAREFIQKHVEALKKQATMWNDKLDYVFFN